MAHTKQCLFCATFTTPKFYPRGSLWEFKLYHKLERSAPQSDLVCQRCYKALRASGPQLEAKPQLSEDPKASRKRYVKTGFSLGFDGRIYQDSIERMTAEEAYHRPYRGNYLAYIDKLCAGDFDPEDRPQVDWSKVAAASAMCEIVIGKDSEIF
jgi:hypothetical protein